MKNFIKSLIDHWLIWKQRQYAAPSPHAIKQSVLLRNGIQNATWVETGTYLGYTTKLLAKHAKSVFSIEPEPTLCANAQKKFSQTKNVTILHGTSEDIFPTLLPTLSGDVNFWLDGHYSADITFKGQKDTPIIEELNVIGKTLAKFKKVAVMVDDLRCFNPKDPNYADYPPLDYLVDWARENRLGWHIEHDIFIAKNF